MGFLDNIFKQKPKEQKPKEKKDEPVIKTVQAQVQKEDIKPQTVQTQKEDIKPQTVQTQKEDIKPQTVQTQKEDIKPQTVQTQKEDIKPQTVQTEVQKEGKKSLDLTKKIALSFEKLNLHKEDVRKKRLFLLDISGSMSERSGERRKIDHLRDVMTPYQDAKMLCFSSNISKVSDAKFIPEPDGGTNLARAFKYIKTDILEKPERVVLVSDGEPDNEKDALEQAKNLSIPVDIIFIGEKESKGYNFMQRLASATGGQEFQVT